MGWGRPDHRVGLPNLILSDSGLLLPHPSFGALQQRAQCPPIPPSLTFCPSPWLQLLIPGEHADTRQTTPVCIFLVVGWCPALQGRIGGDQVAQGRQSLSSSPHLFRILTAPQAVGVDEDVTKPPYVNRGGNKGLFAKTRRLEAVWKEGKGKQPRVS